MLNNKKYLKERIIKSLEDNSHIDYYLLSNIKSQLDKTDDEIYYSKKIVTNNKKVINGNSIEKDNNCYFSIVIDHEKDIISYCLFINGVSIHYISQEGLNSNERVITERQYVGPLPFGDATRKKITIKTNVKKFNDDGYLVYDSNTVHYDDCNFENHIDTVTTIENWYYGLGAACKSSEETNTYREFVLTKTTELLKSEVKVWYGISKKIINDDGNQTYEYKPVGEAEFNTFKLLHHDQEDQLGTKEKIRKLALS